MKKYLLLLITISIYSLVTSQHFRNQIIQGSPTPILDDFEVTKPSANSCAFSQPQIGVDSLGNFTIIWVDSTEGISRICSKQFNSEGDWKFQNTLVTSGANESIHSPKLAMIKDGSFVLTWILESDFASIIEYQQFSNTSIPMSEKLNINNSKSIEVKYPNIAYSSNGIKVVVFTSYNKGNPKIYGQILDENNLKVGSNFSVADNYSKFNQYQSSVAFYEPTDFVVVWNDNREGVCQEHIFGQNFTEEGVKIGSNYKISWYKNSFFPIVSSAENGTYAVVWTCYLFKCARIVYQLIDGRKKSLSANVILDTEYSEPGFKSVSMNDNGETVVTWCYSGYNKNLYAQILSECGEKSIASYPVTTSTELNPNNPSVALSTKNIYTVWEYGGTGSNNTIWANIFRINDIASYLENDYSNLQNNFQLGQNYPNPFNPSTTIKYSIPAEGKITNSKLKSVLLRVYDVLGKEVATLVNENQTPGNYEVDFDGSSLSSGIYFYRLQANDYVETKKMILLK